MSTIRFKALETVLSRRPVAVNLPSSRISDYFAINVFDTEKMKQHLSKESFKTLTDCIENGKPIDRLLADQVASSMRNWATAKGATHYTHWFQPLTGFTAEKHDSFFEPTGVGMGIEKFSAEALVQQEPDASSFPNGGIRTTFEARGYTAWDPSSPAFIMESASGSTLCIPTVFVSYTLESLDFKAPLLKSLFALDNAATAVCQYFDKNVTKVTTTLGIEQEYFLIDTALYNARPDIMLSGRALFGHESAKGQQLEDHYFGTIPDRVQAYMMDFETEALKLGIPVKTRHNEVAPGQFECAPIFEEINLAIDHNQLLMDIMDKVAKKHHFKVLLHEKPFAGVNGSGKHNNWSMSTNTGVNLLSPGKTPKNNLQFLTILACIIKAVHTHADLLRASIASASNDHRLGANEAPPAIISIFMGQQLDAILDEIENAKITNSKKSEANLALGLGIPKVPDIFLDNTDRNRTSPFAFTGNKFEFRAVGSSANSAAPMTVLCSIVADQMESFKKEVDTLLKKNSDKKDVAIVKVIREYIKTSKNIRFEGNGYSDEWEKEAAKRGLSNIKTTPLALDAFTSKETIALFERTKVFTERELHARHEIRLETFTKKIQIESRVIGDLVYNTIIPSAISYQNKLVLNIQGLLSVGLKDKQLTSQLDIITRINEHINIIKPAVDNMIQARKNANTIEDAKLKAIAYDEKVKPFFETIRYSVDKLELLVEDENWALPKFRELLFVK